MAKQFTLGKKERLKSRKAIGQLFDKGQRFVVSPFRVFFAFHNNNEPGGQPLQAGFTASSRIFKTAVDRNRIKRLTKEAWRLQKNELQIQLTEQKRKLHVFFVYTGKELPSYAETASAMELILSKLINFSRKKN